MINQIMNTGANVQLVISATDLKELFFQWQKEYNEEEKRRSAPAPETSRSGEVFPPMRLHMK